MIASIILIEAMLSDALTSRYRNQGYGNKKGHEQSCPSELPLV